MQQAPQGWAQRCPPAPGRGPGIHSLNQGATRGELKLPPVPLGTGGGVRVCSLSALSWEQSWWRAFPSEQRGASPSPAPPPSLPQPTSSRAGQAVGPFFLHTIDGGPESGPFRRHMECCFHHWAPSSGLIISSSRSQIQQACALPGTEFRLSAALRFKISPCFSWGVPGDIQFWLLFPPLKLKGSILPSIHQQMALTDGAQ